MASEPSRTLAYALVVVVGLSALPWTAATPVALACEQPEGSLLPAADTQPDSRARPDRCKRVEGSRAPAPKGCPDGGERLPEDKRSPLDKVPPLSPLVA
jgi:hypothetical protein